MKNAERGTSIANSTRKIQIEKNWHYLRTIAETVLLCAKQGNTSKGGQCKKGTLCNRIFLSLTIIMFSCRQQRHMMLLLNNKNCCTTKLYTFSFMTFDKILDLVLLSCTFN